MPFHILLIYNSLQMLEINSILDWGWAFPYYLIENSQFSIRLLFPRLFFIRFLPTSYWFTLSQSILCCVYATYANKWEIIKKCWKLFTETKSNQNFSNFVNPFSRNFPFTQPIPHDLRVAFILTLKRILTFSIARYSLKNY